MKFIVQSQNKNIISLVRRLGYKVMPAKQGEFNCIKPITSMNYPHFHLFIEEDRGSLIFKLHLDQKKPSYSGVSAHSGQYEGEVVEREAERIKAIVQASSPEKL